MTSKKERGNLGEILTERDKKEGKKKDRLGRVRNLKRKKRRGEKV